ncbi:MAG TPA: hypothetical protein VNG71_18485, partial [Pyrinomonadaceae bacterium]|nr:hypothetical protein [Pyrinomonadaceae bacterium]
SNLQSLVTNSAHSYATSRFKAFGVMSKVPSRLRLPTSSSIPNPADEVRARIRDRVVESRPRNLDERLLDRLDPAHQLDRLARFLWHRDRLATLRGNWMYFYTDLSDGHGLAGINIQNGSLERQVRVRDLDERFITDEAAGMLFFANGNRFLAYPVASD